MADMCTILHLSDIHFGEAHFFNDDSEKLRLATNPSLRESITGWLEKFAATPSLGVPDVVVCSGDYICAWESDATRIQSYASARHLIQSIFEKINKLRIDLGREPLTKKNVLLIPGNHDVRRGEHFTSRYSDFWTHMIKDFYGDETTDIFNHAGDEPPSSISAIFYSADQNLAIVGIDSNVLQDQHRKDYWEEYLNLYKAKYLADDPSDDKIERLKIDYWPGWIDVDLLDQRLEEAKINCPNATLAVAMHHPLAGRFREIHSLDYRPILNCDDVLNILAKHDVALVMHGHKHISDLYSLHHRGSNADKGWHLAVAQAGSMCKSDNPEWQPRDVPPAFNMIRLQLPASKAVMHIQFTTPTEVGATDICCAKRGRPLCHPNPWASSTFLTPLVTLPWWWQPWALLYSPAFSGSWNDSNRGFCTTRS